MAKKQQSSWSFAVIALIIGFVVGYAVAGGLASGGKAIASKGCSSCMNLQQGQVLNFNGKKISLYDVTQTGDTCGVSVDGTLAWIPVLGNQLINGVSVIVNSASANPKSCDFCAK